MQQVLDDRRGICFGGVGLDICKSRPAEVTKDEMDIRIKGWVDPMLNTRAEAYGESYGRRTR